MWTYHGDAFELTEVIYELCHHISGLGALKLCVPHPLESSTWPPVIRSVLNLCCYKGDIMWSVQVNENNQHAACFWIAGQLRLFNQKAFRCRSAFLQGKWNYLSLVLNVYFVLFLNSSGRFGAAACLLKVQSRFFIHAYGSRRVFSWNAKGESVLDSRTNFPPLYSPPSSLSTREHI